MRTLTWNAWVGQDATNDPGPGDLLDNLQSLLEAADWPELVSLQEVPDWSERLRRYRRLAAPRDRFPSREARSTQLLVRRDLVLRRKGFRRAQGPGWTGPKHGHPHDPRVFPFASVLDPQDPRVEWDLMGVHRTREPWSREGAALWGEHRTLVDWCRDTRPGPVLLLGDHNHPEDHQVIRRLENDAHLTAHLRGVDGVLVRGAVVVGQRRIHGRFGGDGHPPILTRLVAKPHA